MRQFIDLVTRLFESQLEEAPISDITHIGDWTKSSSFRHEQDRRLLTNPKAINKIKSLWKYPEDVTTNILLINNSEGNRHTEVGEVDQAWIEKNMPKTAPEILSLLKDDEVNIIFTNNKGSERVPMTAWIMAHRFGHVLSRYGSSYYFKEAESTIVRYLSTLLPHYGLKELTYKGLAMMALRSPEIKGLAQSVCTFRSARENNLRDGYEMVHELFAQYIMTGKITFNDIPKSFKAGCNTIYYRADEDYDTDNRIFREHLAFEMERWFHTAIHGAVGHIYVM